MINCIDCRNYKLAYTSNPKQVRDRCNIYGNYLDVDSENCRFMPCKDCTRHGYIHFKDITKRRIQ